MCESLVAKLMSLVDVEDESSMEALCDLFQASLKKSLTLYCHGKIVSVDPCVQLAKTIVSRLKTVNTVNAAGIKCLIRMLCECLTVQVTRMSEWKSVYGIHRRDSEIDFASTVMLEEGVSLDEIRETLCELNEGWKAWAILGGAIQHLIVLGSRDITFRLFKDDFEIKSMHDVIEYALNLMAEKQLKPVEGDKSWECFWAFTKACEQGKVARTATLKKPRPFKSDKDSTRKRKTLNTNDSSENEASEDDQQDKENASRRRSIRTRTKSVKSYQDQDSDVDMQVNEPLMGTQDFMDSPVALKRIRIDD